ncbi:MAG: hypothetical protein NT151_11845 [Acidobacteria bacterium]|nr:hypothetical protein [Acidobacteriota bacterium]
MSDNVADILITVTPQGLDASFEKILAGLDKVKDGVAGVTNVAQGATAANASWTDSVKSAAMGYIAGMATFEGAKRVVGELADFVKSCVSAYAEAEAGQKRLTVALVSAGQGGTGAIAIYKGLADAIASNTAFERDAIVATEALLVQVGQATPENMELALRAVTDLAAGLGIDLHAATMMVAKAMEGNTTALKKAGVQVDETALQTRGLDAVMEAIEGRFGGQAQAQLDTYAGRVAYLGNQWKETKESLGGAVVQSGPADLALAMLSTAVMKTRDGVEQASGSWLALAGRLNLFGIQGAQTLILLDEMARYFAVLEGGVGRLPAVTEPAKVGIDRVALSMEQADKVAEILDDTVKQQIETNKKAAEEWKKLNDQMDAMSGRKLITDTNTLVATYDRLAKQGLKPTYDEQIKLNDAITKATAAAEENGRAIPAAWAQVTLASSSTRAGIKGVVTEFGSYALAVPPAVDQTDAINEALSVLESRAYAAAPAMNAAQVALSHMAGLMPEVKNQTDEINQGFDALAKDKAVATEKALGNVATGLDGLSRVAEMSGHTTTAAVMSIASTTIKAFATGGPWAAAMAGAMAIFTAFSDQIFKTQGKAVNNLRDAFFATQGGYEKLHAAMIAAGTEGAFYEAWNAKTTADWDKALKDINASLDTQNKKLADEQTLRAGINSQIVDAQTQLETLRAGGVASWSDISTAATKYGINLGGIGVQVQQLQTNDLATQYLNDWNMMAKAGADMTPVLQGMADEFSKLVVDAEGYGTQVPGNMKPVLESLIAQGLLLDNTGSKITDINSIPFGPDIKTAADILNTSIQTLVDKISALVDQLSHVGEVAAPAAAAVQTAFKGMDLGVPSPWSKWGNPPDYAGAGVDSTSREDGVPAFASGGIVRSRTLAIVGDKGPEAIIPLAQLPRVAAATVAAGGGGADLMAELLRQNAKIHMAILQLPQQITRGWRDAQLLSARAF